MFFPIFLLLQGASLNISKYFKSAWKRRFYTINSFGEPLPYKFLMNPAKYQANLQGKMGEMPLPLLEIHI